MKCALRANAHQMDGRFPIPAPRSLENRIGVISNPVLAGININGDDSPIVLGLQQGLQPLMVDPSASFSSLPWIHHIPLRVSGRSPTDGARSPRINTQVPLGSIVLLTPPG